MFKHNMNNPGNLQFCSDAWHLCCESGTYCDTLCQQHGQRIKPRGPLAGPVSQSLTYGVSAEIDRPVIDLKVCHVSWAKDGLYKGMPYISQSTLSFFFGYLRSRLHLDRHMQELVTKYVISQMSQDKWVLEQIVTLVVYESHCTFYIVHYVNPQCVWHISTCNIKRYFWAMQELASLWKCQPIQTWTKHSQWWQGISCHLFFCQF